MIRIAAIVLALAALAAGGARVSGADFVAASPSPGNTFAAAPDFNTVAVALTDPGTPLRGTTTLTATAVSERGIDHVTFQSAPTGTSTWTDICTVAAAPYTCSWSTAGVADGSRDVRALAVDQAGYQRAAAVTARLVDNTAPTAAVSTGSPVRGTADLDMTATDGAGSGIKQVTGRLRAQGTTTWTTLCVSTAAPYGCTGLDTTQVADGVYEVQAVAEDNAGFSTTSATATMRVDNAAPAVALTAPAGTLSGSAVALTATATDAGAGVTSVAFERSPAGANAWVSICTDSATPYTCAFNTAALADGSYDLRARATDGAGNQATSMVTRLVDNNTPAGTAVATGNGGTTAGLLEPGDWIAFTWSEPLAPASILSGWTGPAQAIRVAVTNSSSNDRMDFYNAAGTTRLNLVNSATDLQLNANFVTGTVWFNATMVQSGGTITVTLGSKLSGTPVTAAGGTITWRPSSAAKDLAGKSSSTATVTETGAADRDF